MQGCFNAIPNIYLDLESERDRAKLAQPALYLSDRLGKRLILGEMHRAPHLFPVLRDQIDQARRNGKRVGLYPLLDEGVRPAKACRWRRARTAHASTTTAIPWSPPSASPEPKRPLHGDFVALWCHQLLQVGIGVQLLPRQVRSKDQPHVKTVNTPV